MTRPEFSIVIPTRNRAGLLRPALSTALATADTAGADVEVLVSDNASEDATGVVVAETADARVRSVRSAVPLSNADSWEFALSHARGEWVTVLGDDDGFAPSLLARMQGIVPERPAMVVWHPAWYVHPDTDPPWPVAAERNQLSVPAFSGRGREMGAADQLDRLFARREIDPIPGLVNCFVRRDRLDDLRQRAGRVFGEPDPNWAAAVGLLAGCHSYLVLDLPLTVAGVSPVNIGGGFLRNTRAHSVIEEFDHERLFTEVPTQARTCANLIAETLLRARGSLPSELGHLELDMVRYFVTTRGELADRRRAPDAGEALAEWRAALRRQPAGVAAAVRRELTVTRLGQLAREAVRRAPSAARLRRRLRRVGGQTPFRLLAGAEHGFCDLPGATRALEVLLPEPALLPAPPTAARPTTIRG